MDPSSKRTLPTHLGIRITPDLRGKLAAAAEAAGISDSTWVRRLIADALSDAAPVDRVSGPRSVTKVPAEDLAATSRMLGTLTTFLLRAREGGQGEAPGVIAAMEAAHERLVRTIERLERETQRPAKLVL